MTFYIGFGIASQIFTFQVRALWGQVKSFGVLSQPLKAYSAACSSGRKAPASSAEAAEKYQNRLTELPDVFWLLLYAQK